MLAKPSALHGRACWRGGRAAARIGWLLGAFGCALVLSGAGCGGSGGSADAGGGDLVFVPPDGGVAPVDVPAGVPDASADAGRADAGDGGAEPADAPAPDAGADSPMAADTVAPPVDVPPDDVGPPPDQSDPDRDNVPTSADNCPTVPNTSQTDGDGDGLGDACDGDRDGDDVPNDADAWPDDASQPGVCLDEAVYAHTSDRLFRMDVKTFQVSDVGPFGWPSDGYRHEMTDIAIDRHGVLYGVSFDALYICHPDTARCQHLAALPALASFNGLTFVPGATFSEAEDVLIAMTQEGGWYRIRREGTTARAEALGEYGGYCSTGDAYSAEGVGTFAAANRGSYPCGGDTYVVQVDPVDGAVTNEIAALAGYDTIYGLAGWTEQAFAFDAGGDILVVNVQSGSIQRVIPSPNAWWGAGTRTVF